MLLRIGSLQVLFGEDLSREFIEKFWGIFSNGSSSSVDN
jgi:hypothetical protein